MMLAPAILFSVWVTFTERYWVSFRERRRKKGKGFFIGGQGTFGPFAVAIGKKHQVALFLEYEMIVGQVVMLSDVLDHSPEKLRGALRSGFLQERFERYLP